jgi:RNA polymerase sigma factor (sigma-70 family)
VSLTLRAAAAVQGRDPEQDASDLVHDVVVILLARDGRELHRWDPQRGRTLDSWVRLLARRRVRRVLSGGRGNPWAEPPIAMRRDDEDECDEQRLEVRDRLRRILEGLDRRMGARDRVLFRALFVEQADRDQVAAALRMTRAAVDAWCYRTRRIARAIARELDS